MYKRISNNKTHIHYSIEEKNQIVLLYLDRHMSISQIIRTYDLAGSKILINWVNQYKTYGTCVDNRGKSKKGESPNKGRTKNNFDKPLEEYTKEELIERCKLLEDIKKSVACLEISKQKKNTKS